MKVRHLIRKLKQIVASRELRLNPGDKILVVVYRGKVLMVEKPKSYHSAIRG